MSITSVSSESTSSRVPTATANMLPDGPTFRSSLLKEKRQFSQIMTSLLNSFSGFSVLCAVPSTKEPLALLSLLASVSSNAIEPLFGYDIAAYVFTAYHKDSRARERLAQLLASKSTISKLQKIKAEVKATAKNFKSINDMMDKSDHKVGKKLRFLKKAPAKSKFDARENIIKIYNGVRLGYYRALIELQEEAQVIALEFLIDASKVIADSLPESYQVDYLESASRRDSGFGDISRRSSVTSGNIMEGRLMVLHNRGNCAKASKSYFPALVSLDCGSISIARLDKKSAIVILKHDWICCKSERRFDDVNFDLVSSSDLNGNTVSNGYFVSFIAGSPEEADIWTSKLSAAMIKQCSSKVSAGTALPIEAVLFERQIEGQLWKFQEPSLKSQCRECGNDGPDLIDLVSGDMKCVPCAGINRVAYRKARA